MKSSEASARAVAARRAAVAGANGATSSTVAWPPISFATMSRYSSGTSPFIRLATSAARTAGEKAAAIETSL